MERKQKILVIVLVACLVVSLFFNAYQCLSFRGYNSSTSKTFVYEWPRGSFAGQRIVNDTLRLELTVEWGEETLDMVAKINDDEYHWEDYLGLVFDRNGNGFIDYGMSDAPYLLGAANYTTAPNQNALTRDNTIEWLVDDIPHSSPYHYCVFTEDVGYTFNITIPKSELSDVKADMLFIVFIDTDYPHTPNLDYLYRVSLMVEGW